MTTNPSDPPNKAATPPVAVTPQSSGEKTFVEENIASMKTAAKDEVKRGTEWMVRRVIATLSWEFTRLLQNTVSKLFRR